MHWTIEQATPTFVQAIAHLKSSTYPHVAEPLAEGCWALHDEPSRKLARKIEVVSCNLGAIRATELATKRGLGWHFVCEISPIGADLNQVTLDYKALGYRALSTETYFVHDLVDIPPAKGKLQPRLVDSENYNEIHQRAHQPRKLQEGLTRLCIWTDRWDLGWVTSVDCGEGAWVSDLYVFETERRKGYGHDLMSAVLAYQKEQGYKQSVLTASKAGATLYPQVGYKHIGTLQIFCPKARA